jgi:hypothetical protein
MIIEAKKNMPVKELKAWLTEEVLEKGINFTFSSGEIFNFKLVNGYTEKKRDQLIKNISSARKESDLPSVLVEAE